MTSYSSPGIPGLANRGTCRVGVAKWIFPQPPLPPLATVTGSFPETSASNLPVSQSFISVPRGTLIMRFSAFFPELRLDLPFSPFGAMYFRL